MILNNLKFTKIQFGTDLYKKLLDFRFNILRVPLKLEWSEEDLKNEDKQYHFAVFLNKEIIGCCVLKKLSQTKIKLRQMAVSENFRGNSIGSYIIKMAEIFCIENGYSEIVLTARCYAVNFYKKNGFSSFGDVFLDVTLESIMMKKVLNDKYRIS